LPGQADPVPDEDAARRRPIGAIRDRHDRKVTLL
jgi:hypothetical protein